MMSKVFPKEGIVRNMFLVSLCVALFLCAFTLGAAECGAVGAVKVDKLEGTAKSSPDQQTWAPLKSGQEVPASHFVKTEAASRLMLIFPDGSALKVGENSLVSLTEIVSNSSCERESYKMKVFFGKIWSNVKKLVSKNEAGGFVVESKNAVAGVRGTSFGFVVEADGAGALMVENGKVEIAVPAKPAEPKKMNIQEWKKNRSRQEVAGPKEIGVQEWEKIVVDAMQMVKFSADGTLSKPIPIGAANADAWYRENAPVK